MSERILIIKAKGGLGNRMLSAVTGLAVAELTGRTPVIDWRDGVYAAPGVNAYPLLFDTPIALDPAAFDARRDVRPAIWAGNLREHPTHLIHRYDPNRHSDPFVYRKYSVNLARLDEATPLAVFWSYLPKLARLRGKLERHPRFAGKSLEQVTTELLDQYFTPNARVRKEVAAIFEGRPRPIIGVHIRYTDFKAPLGKLKDGIRTMRRQLPEAGIFLATDNGDVQKEIAAEFDRVFFIEKWLAAGDAQLHQLEAGKDPVREAENAMIDMWALAACDRLIHARSSTFSAAAALIGGIAPDRQIDVDATNLKVVVKRWVQNYT